MKQTKEEKRQKELRREGIQGADEKGKSRMKTSERRGEQKEQKERSKKRQERRMKSKGD